MNNKEVRTGLVSVIIPTYNRKQLVADAVESCLRQSYSDIEVIIVDDGSTDGTDQLIMDKLREDWLHKNVRYVWQANTGASAARNRGLELAEGEFIQYLDSDDVLLEDKIVKQVRVLCQATPVPDLCSCYGRIGVIGQPLQQCRRIGVASDSPREHIRHVCAASIVHGMQASAPLWRRAFLEGRHGWRTDIGLGDDFEYSIRLLSDAKSMSFVAEELFMVREHAGDRLSSVGQSVRQVESAVIAHQSVVECLRKVGAWDRSTQKGTLRTARTLYANLLSIDQNEKSIRQFEAWMMQVAMRPAFHMLPLNMVLIRRLLGSGAILKMHSIAASLR